ncbi:hypothetical protein P7K49_037313 [Saguinus oedipus]|uniref:EF-hand domain-containing protein n=1 Tax=Saguinus oedipus TaxID=9490 RepID=A0ABQ9TIB5_SAGOE|nr:hypothetical protein P7K49_037313 [Saguinus oedipus]
MTDLLRSVVTVIDVFYKYTKQDEECGTLSKDELKELLEKEFRPILKNPDDPDTVEVIMHMLDRDHDRRLDFTEFLLMVFKLALACNKVLSKEYCKASGSKKRRHGHQHQEEESETEEDEEDTPGRNLGKNMNLDVGQRVGEEKVMVVSHVDWRLVSMNQTLLSQEVEDKSLSLTVQVQEVVGGEVMHVVIAIRVGVEGHKLLLVLVSHIDLEGKDINLAVRSQAVSQKLMEDKVMAVSQEVSPLDVVNLSLTPVASPIVREVMELENMVNHRTVEDNREQAQVNPLVDNMGLEVVSLVAMVNMNMVPVATFQTLLVQMNFPNVVNMDLVQISLLPVNNMEQA